ncbi:hypothetical protein PCANC_04857 [Puccinia coronata f. sp. avenae]|uniref:Protein kinase domain-containing protein n=1 Tax=Puccinia coronata f. sp. avenae TaxID=200324 RepID=A0A2N5W2G4_9BASI|nr:hypothetical protein PCANC_04857 [Puccinia coronata f. sp. avenae]
MKCSRSNKKKRKTVGQRTVNGFDGQQKKKNQTQTHIETEQSSPASDSSDSDYLEANQAEPAQFKTGNHLVRVLEPLTSNKACTLTRKFVNLPHSHLNRLYKPTTDTHQTTTTRRRRRIMPFKTLNHQQIIPSRPICNTLPTSTAIPDEPRPNRKRKRARTTNDARTTTTTTTTTEDKGDNEKSRQVMVIINRPRSPPLLSQQSVESRCSSQELLPSLLPEPTSYYIHQASKAQLLRLRRDQLIQLIKTGWEKHDRNEQVEETEHKNKDSLAAFIVNARSNPSKKSVLFPSQSHPSSKAAGMDQSSPKDDVEEHQPWPVTRLQTRVKSFPDYRQMDTSQRTHQNGSVARSRSQQRKWTAEADDQVPETTRKTRSATQAISHYQTYSSSNSSAWSSSVNSERLVEAPPAITRTPRRHSERRKAVKFIGHRSGGPTPVAFRTRRSSNHHRSSATRTSASSKSHSVRARNTPTHRSLRHEVVTPTRCIRKLRNGKVIPLKKMIGDQSDDQLPTRANKTGAITPQDRAHVPSDNDDDSVTVEDASETEHEAENQQNEQDDLMASGSEMELSLAPSDPKQGSNSDGDAFDIAEDQSIQIDSVHENDEEEDEDDNDNDGEDEDDEDDILVDLSQATTRGLLRLKRDNLIRLCEEREIEAAGTKKDMVQNLLAWRDTNEAVSPSSDVSQTTPQPSTHSEGPEPTPIVDSPEITFLTADGTSSRPIILDSTIEDAKPPAEKKAIKTPTGSKVALQKKDDIGELLDLESLNLQDKEIQPEQLKKLEMIGSGGFKDVYRGIYKKVPVAIAEIRGHLTEMDLKELRILRDLRHENIVRFIGVSVPTDSSHSTSSASAGAAATTTTTTTAKAGSIGSKKKMLAVEDNKPHHIPPIMVVTEICTNGDLFDYLRKIPSPGFLKICHIFRDICSGLHYLHSRSPKIIHRDLKSSNVLITSKGVAKLNDFGLARIKNSTRSMVKSLVGTVNWQAPELWVAHPRYNEKVDVYSAGLVLWEMLQWHQPVKRYPFEGQNEHAIYQDVGHRQLRPATAGMRRQWGDEILNLVEKLWAQNPADRPRMDAVLVELDAIVAGYKPRTSS